MTVLSIGTIAPGGKAKIDEIQEQELIGVQTAIEPDGSAMKLTLHTSEGQAIRLSVPFGQSAVLSTEVHQAALLMLYRQTAAPEQAGRAIDDLIRAAVRPTKVSVGIDRMTGDRLFFQEFGGERMPRVVRMSPDAVNDTIEALSVAATAHAN
ncbi:MAG: hypothetical protein E5W76_28220 [Mesorhizobium sp.]|nr:MAG: hypothetical protein E5W76_28220 [Mesorhizobium sp.]